MRVNITLTILLTICVWTSHYTVNNMRVNNTLCEHHTEHYITLNITSHYVCVLKICCWPFFFPPWIRAWLKKATIHFVIFLYFLSIFTYNVAKSTLFLKISVYIVWKYQRECLLADTRHIFYFKKHAMTFLLYEKTSFESHENSYWFF
jgi:hypothetical protein